MTNLVYIGDIADTKGDGACIERIVREREVLSIAANPLHTRLPNSFLAHVQHSWADVQHCDLEASTGYQLMVKLKTNG